MRIVAGTARGRRLAVPEGDTTRPTADRVREAVFNSLRSLGAVEGARVLDLYAGSGAMAIEALSRGAASAVLVETDPAAGAAIEANLAALGFDDRAELVRRPVELVLDDRPEADLVICDPPYAFDDWPNLLARLDAEVVVVESDREIDVEPRWRAHRVRRYGSTVVTLAVRDSPRSITT